MSEVKWNDRFNIGVEIVDRAHKKLFSIVGKLLSLTEDAEKQKHACQEGIKYFKSYTMKHFALKSDGRAISTIVLISFLLPPTVTRRYTTYVLFLVGRPLSSNLNVAIGEIIRVKITITGNFAGNAHAVQPEYDYKDNSKYFYRQIYRQNSAILSNLKSLKNLQHFHNVLI